MVRRVKAYLRNMKIITDEERLHAMSLECEPPAAGTSSHSISQQSVIELKKCIALYFYEKTSFTFPIIFVINFRFSSGNVIRVRLRRPSVARHQPCLMASRTKRPA
jgi:hypothetical protein